jgi:hypothetical protein
MQVSHLHKLILIENPRCANFSVADMLQAEPIEGFARFATAADLKSEGALPPQFEGYSVMVAVRNPLERFVSAISLTISKSFDEFTKQEIADYGGSAFEDLAIYLSDFNTLTSATEGAIEWFKTANEWPTIFKSQIDYLSGDPDLVVAFTTLAEFANAHKNFERGLNALNFDMIRSREVRYVANEFKAPLTELLIEDVNRLKTQPVWTREPNLTRTAEGGGCGGCGKKTVPAAKPVEDVAFPKD